MAFAKKVTVANKYEIEAGQLALDKAQRDDVKQLAQMIVSDHEKAGNDLKTAVGAEASGLPAALDSKHTQLLDQLKKASGQQFDRLYVQQQVQAHKEAVALFRDEAKKTNELQQFAQTTLPALENHLKMAQEAQRAAPATAKKGGGSSATGAGSGTGTSRNK
jgi:putative membrane protein